MAKKAGKKAATPAKGGDDDNGEAMPKKGGKLKIIVFAVAGLLVVGTAAGGGLWYFGMLDSLLGKGPKEASKPKEKPKQHAEIDFGPPVFVDMPETVVDLKVNTCTSPYIKFRMTVEVPQKLQPVVVANQTRIMDAAQQHIRGLTRQDLVGEEGAKRLREDMKRVVEHAIRPEKITGVLFKKFLLQ